MADDGSSTGASDTETAARGCAEFSETPGVSPDNPEARSGGGSFRTGPRSPAAPDPANGAGAWNANGSGKAGLFSDALVVGQPGKTAGSIGSFPDPEAQERGEACSAAPGSWGGIGEERAAPSVEMVIPSEIEGRLRRPPGQQTTRDHHGEPGFARATRRDMRADRRFQRVMRSARAANRVVQAMAQPVRGVGCRVANERYTREHQRCSNVREKSEK